VDTEDLQGADAGAGAEPDLRSELSAAFDEFDGGDNSGTGAATSTATNAQRGERPASAPAQETAAQAAQRARDEQGRFAKPGDATQTQSKIEPKTPEQAAAASQTPSTPPATWSAAAKAKFASLDPEVQREVLKRETEMDQGRAQWQQGAERLNRLDAILAPRRERFALAGVDEVRAVQALFAAQDLLERQPVDALLYLGRQAGVDWRAVFQRLQGAPAQQQPQVPPGMEPLVRQVQTLTQHVTQQQRDAEQGRRNEHLSQVQQFAADPKNIYFENVRDRMGQLLRSGGAKDLSEAYEQACWADPQVRPLMVQAQAQEQQRQATEAARARTALARHASGSVIGSPRPGASGSSSAPSATLRDDLSQAWDAAAA
jgi:hypothetical protein